MDLKMEFIEESFYKKNLVPIIETKEVRVDDIELSEHDLAIIERINLDDERFRSQLNSYEKNIDRRSYIIVEEKGEDEEKYKLLISQRRYLFARHLKREYTRIAVVSHENAEKFRMAIEEIKRMLAADENFVKIGNAIVEVLDSWQIKREELCDMIDIHVVILSRLTAYQQRATELEKKFADEGWIDSPNNFERMRTIPDEAKEKLLEYARNLKRPLTRSEIDKAKEYFLRNRSKVMNEILEPADDEPEEVIDDEIEAIERELAEAFGEKMRQEKRGFNHPNPKAQFQQVITKPKPMFTENEMRLFLASQNADWRVADEELPDVFKATVIAVAESAPEELKRKVKRDRILDEAEKAAMEGRIDPKIILEMIKLMKETV